jgi:putative oxidoreductase
MRARPPPTPALQRALGMVQVLAALAFLGAGLLKLLTPYDQLASHLGWVAETPVAVVKFIGVVEIAGALGLVLPSATRVKPGLTTLAAAGLTFVMVLAVGVHLARSEFRFIPVTFALGGACAFVAWGRFKHAY